MPARVIRGEINSSASLSRVSVEADLLFRALLVAVDDYGRHDGRLEIVKASCFPLRAEFDLDRIAGLLDELRLADGNGAGPIQCYEVNGRPYLALVSWDLHRGRSRRAANSKYPPPPIPEAEATSVDEEIARGLRLVRERKAGRRVESDGT